MRFLRDSVNPYFIQPNLKWTWKKVFFLQKVGLWYRCNIGEIAITISIHIFSNNPFDLNSNLSYNQIKMHLFFQASICFTCFSTRNHGTARKLNFFNLQHFFLFFLEVLKTRTILSCNSCLTIWYFNWFNNKEDER